MTLVRLELIPGQSRWRAVDLSGRQSDIEVILTIDSAGRLMVGHNTELYAEAEWKGDHWEWTRRVPKLEADEWLSARTAPKA